MRRIFLILMLFWASLWPAAADDGLSALKQDLDLARAAFDVPGLAIAIVKDGRVVLAEGLGQRGLTDATAVDGDTRFAIGSCTKAFAAFGVAMLQEQGKLAVEDRVSAHDPMLQLSDPSAQNTLTIAHLLTQRSGLARHDFLWHARADMSRADFAKAQRSLAMQGFPGRYGYTNSAYILAGRVIELKSGQSWEDFTTRSIFSPLGMTRSNFSSEGMRADANAAQAVKRRDAEMRVVAWRDGRLLSAAGSVNSTAHDMARWLLMLTGNGAIEGRAIVRPETLNSLWRPASGLDTQNPRRGLPEDAGGYAMGWRVDEWRGHRRISHSGAIDGFRARVTIIPEHKLGIAIMVNLAPSQLPDFASRVVAEHFLGMVRQTDLAALAAARREAEIRALGQPAPLPRGRTMRMGDYDTAVAPTRPLAEFYGVYAHAAYGDLRIEPAADGAGLRITFGPLAGRLDHWRADGFVAFSDLPDDTLDESEILFRAAPDGSVAGFSAMIDNDIAPIYFPRISDLPVQPIAPTQATMTGGKPRPSFARDAYISTVAIVLGMVLLAFFVRRAI